MAPTIKPVASAHAVARSETNILMRNNRYMKDDHTIPSHWVARFERGLCSIKICVRLSGGKSDGVV